MNLESTFNADGSLADYTSMQNIQRLMQVSADQQPNTSPVATNNSGGSASTQPAASSTAPPSRYESQKRRDWNTFGQYLRNHRPPLALGKCSGANVLEFLRYLDQFGKTKVHMQGCAYFGQPQPPAACACPLRQAWGSLDALIGRLRAAFEENGGRPELNPFGARAVRLYLREVREMQAKARGIAYEKKKRRRPPESAPVDATGLSSTPAPATPAGCSTLSPFSAHTAPSPPLIHHPHSPDCHRQQASSTFPSYASLSPSLLHILHDDGCPVPPRAHLPQPAAPINSLFPSVNHPYHLSQAHEDSSSPNSSDLIASFD